MEIRGQATGATCYARLRSSSPFASDLGPNIASEIKADNLIFSGTFLVANTGAGPTAADVEIQTGIAAFEQSMRVVFDIVGGTWILADTGGPPGIGAALAGPFTLTGYTPGVTTVGFRVEIRRYRVRVRLWDAGSAEPSTWDVDMFRTLRDGGGTFNAYPYGDDEGIANLEVDLCTVALLYIARSFIDNTDYATILWDDIVVEHDAGGTNESAHALVERPEGNEIGRIELPAGCQHFVYWGAGDWTALDSGFPYLSWSAKAWNDAGAAELQRSEAVWWWFRSVHAGGIVSMHWKEGNRKPSIRRIAQR